MLLVILHTNLVSESKILGNMAEGTHDYKRLESMFKESDQKRKNDLLRVECHLGLALAEIKSLINGIMLQLNEIRNQMANKDIGGHMGSILGNLMSANGERQASMVNVHTKYATKLNFPRFGRKGVDDWIFRVEQFFTLDRVPEGSKD